MGQLFALSQAFKLWMLYDAYQRRPEAYWYPIILFVPLGEWVYFFAVRSQDRDVVALKRRLLPDRPPSIHTLRYRAQQSPSVAAKTELARALVDAGQPVEAVELLGRVLEREPGDVRALHGLGRALSELGRPAEAVPVFDRLLARDPRYLGGDARIELALACFASGNGERGLTELTEVGRATGRLDAKLLLAERLGELGRRGEARELLAEALLHHEHSPRYVRRANARFAREAKAMLRTLP